MFLICDKMAFPYGRPKVRKNLKTTCIGQKSHVFGKACHNFISWRRSGFLWLNLHISKCILWQTVLYLFCFTSDKEFPEYRKWNFTLTVRLETAFPLWNKARNSVTRNLIYRQRKKFSIIKQEKSATFTDMCLLFIHSIVLLSVWRKARNLFFSEFATECNDLVLFLSIYKIISFT